MSAGTHKPAEALHKIEDHSDGWIQDGPLLYRLTEEKKPKNRDEINVTMADGSRTEEARTRRASQLLDAIRAAAPQAVQHVPWCPDVCPITGRKFFMWIEHWATGKDVPTYGGPYDSYTIPVKEQDGTFTCERYDHDAGEWMTEGMGWECVGVMLVDDQSFVVDPKNPRYMEIEEFATQPAAQGMDAKLANVARRVVSELSDSPVSAFKTLQRAVDDCAALADQAKQGGAA